MGRCGQRAIARNCHSVGSGLIGRGNINLFHVVHVVLACRRHRIQCCIGPVADKRHDIGTQQRAARRGNREIEVVAEVRIATVVRLRRADRICPAEGDADRTDPVPLERMRPTAHRGGQRILDHFRRSETRLVRDDHIGCRLHIDQTPAEFVIRPRVAQIIGRVNEQALQHARTHPLSDELARIQLSEQRGRARDGWRGHARAAVRGIGSVGGIDRRVNSDTVGHHVRLDAAVVGRAPTGEVRHRAGRRGTHTAAHRVVDRTNGQNIFRKTVVGDRLEPALGREKVLLITCRPADQVVRHVDREQIRLNRLAIVDAHIGSSCVVSVGMVRERYLGGVTRRGSCAGLGHLCVVAVPVP